MQEASQGEVEFVRRDEAGMIEELKGIPLFAVLPDEELRRIVEEGVEKRVARGGLNAQEGQPVEHLHVLLEGELRITKKVQDGEMVINTYGPGTFFGEVPLLAGTPFVASGRALSDCRLFLLPEEVFRRLLTSSAPFSNIILETMAQRVQILQSVSQQRERLNSLGTLAAGLAHELNNPAAASRRAAERVRESFESLRSSGIKLLRAGLGPEEIHAFEGAVHDALEHAANAPRLDPLEQSDKEDELAGWLEERGVAEWWDLAPTFAAARMEVDGLRTLAGVVSSDLFPEALRYLEAVLGVVEALDEVEKGTARVSALVGAVRSYSYLDRAPVQEVDINEGLESTLAVLGHKLGDSIEVTRDYDPNLPRITAYGSELNQVWTQLLDNAIDAVCAGERDARVLLRTTCEADRVLVEISDNGPGVPTELQERVFEPFFTTKGVGAGAGLGLDISYRIVVGRHGGDIRVVSEPGDTRFQVRLPLAAVANSAAGDGAGGDA